MKERVSGGAADPRRELRIVCDENGSILEADEVAERLIGARPGAGLSSLSVIGGEAKLQTFLSSAALSALDDWELALVCQGKPATFSCSSRPFGEGQLVIYAVRLPDGQASAVQSLSDTMAEMTHLNRDLSRQRKALSQKNDELSRAYRELDESNRGVVSLHAELADRSDALRHALDIRGRLVANVSHEFRTPLHSILGLSRLLLDGSDGPLTEEQKKQLRYIRTAAEELSQLVNDLLDLSKAESGQAMLRPQKFSLLEFVSALRGMLRPLVQTPDVELCFEVDGDAVIDSDQGKLSQIVRNLVSNALKFTERGRVVVKAEVTSDELCIAVSDTGVGIAREHFDRVFEEFGQVENPLQKRVKGTGLGLPLSRRLSEVLGGTLTLESTLGEGSTFTLRVPRIHPEVSELSALEARPLDPSRAPVLVVEDDRKTIFIYEKFLSLAGFQVVPARDTDGARRLLKDLRPAAIVLDIMLEGESSWEFLSELKQSPETHDIPVLVVTVTNKEQKARALGADEFWLKPVDQGRLLRKLRSLARSGASAKVLVIDDDEKARYLVRRFLEKSAYALLEASDGVSGVEAAREHQPDVILLDFLLHEHTAFDVLDELKADPRTRSIPVVVVTSHALPRDDLERLSSHTEAVLSKENLSRELAINRIRDALTKAGLRAEQAQGATDASR